MQSQRCCHYFCSIVFSPDRMAMNTHHFVDDAPRACHRVPQLSGVLGVAGGGGMERRARNGAALDTATKKAGATAAAVAAVAAVKIKIKQCNDEVEQLHALRTKATAHLKAAKVSASASLREVQGKASEAKRYDDPFYWEERHAKDGLGGATHEWYVDYPGTALRQVL